MNISRLVSGMILFLAGIIMIIFSFFSEARVVFLIYGIPFFFIGIAILLNSKEDNIEQIKKRKENNISKRKHKGGKDKK